MTNEEKINLIGQKILILSNNLDKYKTELDLLKQQLSALQQHQEPLAGIKNTPPVIVHENVKYSEPVIEKIIPNNTAEPVLQEFTPPPLQKIKVTSSFNFSGNRSRNWC
jgi:hypothetical protein